MKLKVCGMKYPDNVSAVAALAPDYMGFIFYKPSKRYCGETLTPEFVKTLPASIIKTGVFVNESLEEVLRICTAYKFKAVQLHGHETPEFCLVCKEVGLEVIKVFHVGETMDWAILEPYKKVSDYFLFDTQTPEYGGSGKRFNWEILNEYDNEIPLFLSGGVDERILEEFDTLKKVHIYALDINSRFELEPGLKDVERIKKFKLRLKIIQMIRYKKRGIESIKGLKKQSYIIYRNQIIRYKKNIEGIKKDKVILIKPNTKGIKLFAFKYKSYDSNNLPVIKPMAILKKTNKRSHNQIIKHSL